MAQRQERMSSVGFGLAGLGIQVPMAMEMVNMLMVLVVVFFCAEHESVVVDMVVLVNVVVDLCMPFGKGSHAFSIFPGIAATHVFHMTGL